MRRIVFAALLLVASTICSFAASEGFTVTTCGTLSPQYTIPSFNAFAVDINGNTCIVAATPAAGTAGAGYPPGATPVTASATGSTGAISATLPAVAGKFGYLCGLSYQGSDATAAVAGNIAVTGLISGTANFGYVALAAGAAVPQPPPITQTFSPCVQSSAVNTAIVVTPPTLGAGATLATVSVWGFTQ